MDAFSYPEQGIAVPCGSAAAARSILRTEITVRKKDWHATLVRMELADRVFEAAELSYQELPLTAVPANVFREREPAVETVARVMPERTSQRVPALPSGDPDALKLRVRGILRAWGADLGEPVEMIHRPRTRRFADPGLGRRRRGGALILRAELAASRGGPTRFSDLC